MTATLVIPTLGGLTVVACVYTVYTWIAVNIGTRRAIRKRLEPQVAHVPLQSHVTTDILRKEPFSDIPQINAFLEHVAL